MSSTKLVRSENNKMVAGVCGGLAEYLDLDPALVRLAFVVLTLASGIAIPIYIALAVITPRESQLDDDFGYGTSDMLHGELRTRKNSRFFAGLLVVLGVYFLLSNIGFSMNFLWPLLLIGGGVWLITRSRRNRS